MRASSDCCEEPITAETGIIDCNRGMDNTGRSRRRDTLLLHIFGAFTRKGYFCALVDADGSFDCIMADGSGIVLDKLLLVCCKKILERSWLRLFKCTRNDEAKNNSYRNDTTQKLERIERSKSITPAQPERLPKLSSLEQAFKAADILLHSGGFAVIAVDLNSIEEARLRKVPLTTWFRFARVASRTQTDLIFLTSTPVPYSLGLRLCVSSGSTPWSSSKTDYVDNCDAAMSIDIMGGKGSRQRQKPRKAVIYLPDIRQPREMRTHKSILSTCKNVTARPKYMFHIASNSTRD